MVEHPSDAYFQAKPRLSEVDECGKDVTVHSTEGDTAGDTSMNP